MDNTIIDTLGDFRSGFFTATGKAGPVVKVNDADFTGSRYHTVASVYRHIQYLGRLVGVCLKLLDIERETSRGSVDDFQSELAV